MRIEIALLINTLLIWVYKPLMRCVFAWAHNIKSYQLVGNIYNVEKIERCTMYI